MSNVSKFVQGIRQEYPSLDRRSIGCRGFRLFRRPTNYNSVPEPNDFSFQHSRTRQSPPNMPTTSDLAEEFQNRDIHDRWEAVYRDNPRQDRFNDQMMRRFLRLMDLPSDARVLDAGCGVGDHTFRFAKAGFHCTGIDISEHVLTIARAEAKRRGLTGRTEFICAGLESLPGLQPEFDAVHCRGVLMHIPNWQAALSELCRLLKPGGQILVLENNHRSVECLGVQLIRMIRRSESTLEKTPSGWVFHNTDPQQAPLTRIADQPALANELRRLGVTPTHRLATEFWDLNRFSPGFIRNRIVDFNRCYFQFRLPATLSLGNAVIGRK